MGMTMSNGQPMVGVDAASWPFAGPFVPGDPPTRARGQQRVVPAGRASRPVKVGAHPSLLPAGSHAPGSTVPAGSNGTGRDVPAGTNGREIEGRSGLPAGTNQTCTPLPAGTNQIDRSLPAGPA